MKIGIDLHGIIDKDEKWEVFVKSLMSASRDEVYVLTGASYLDAKRELQRLGYIQGVHYLNILSVTDYLLDKNYTWKRDEHNRPAFDVKVWNRAKGWIAEDVGLDVHIDDSTRYKPWFPWRTKYIIPGVIQ